MCRKLWLVGLAMAGPEFVFQSSLGQWCSARRSIKLFRSLGITDWTIAQGFYLDMGGIMLRTVDFPDIPIDARQLHYLISRGYVCYADVEPFVDARNIEQKNKVDSLVRVFTIVQTLWFVVTVAARAVQGLAITTLELTTLAFIICSLGTFFCWYHKPADVRYPDVVRSKASMAQILVEAGEDADRVYNYTPLDFVSRREWQWSVCWSHWCNILTSIGVHLLDTDRPIKRLQTTQFLKPDFWADICTLVVTVTYLGTFLVAWDFSFPSLIERTIWRIASAGGLLAVLTYVTVHYLGFYGYNFGEDHYRACGRPGQATKMPADVKASWWRRSCWRMARTIRNNSVLKDPTLDAPLKAILPSYVLCTVYSFARTYIWLEDIIALRSLPASAYITVSWSAFFPHV